MIRILFLATLALLFNTPAFAQTKKSVCFKVAIDIGLHSGTLSEVRTNLKFNKQTVSLRSTDNETWFYEQEKWNRKRFVETRVGCIDIDKSLLKNSDVALSFAYSFNIDSKECWHGSILVEAVGGNNVFSQDWGTGHSDVCIPCDWSWNSGLISNSEKQSFNLYELGPAYEDLRREHKELASLKSKVKKIKKEIRALENSNHTLDELIDEQTANLDIFLRELETLTEIGQVDSSRLREIDSRLNATADSILNMRRTKKELSGQLEDKVNDIQNTLQTIQQAATEETLSENLDPSDPHLYDAYQIAEITIDALAVDSNSEVPLDGTDTDNPYLHQSQIYTDRLEQLGASCSKARPIPAHNRLEFILIKKHWSEAFGELLKQLKNRGSAVSQTEFKFFDAAYHQVETCFSLYIDNYGFFKSIPIPVDVKKIVKEDLKTFSREHSEILARTLNRWPTTQLTPEQENVFALIRAIGRASKTLNRDTTGAYQAVKATLTGLVDLVTTLALGVTQLFVGLSPVGDSIDACELITGYSFCNPQGSRLSTQGRVLAAAGLIIGSGHSWRLLAKSLKVESNIIKSGEELIELARQTGLDETQIRRVFDAAGKSGFAKAGDVKHLAKGWKSITPKMESKILYGTRKSPNRNQLIGAHSPRVKNNSDFDVETIRINPDGTQNVKLVKQYSDGKVSNIKSSTLFPDPWSDEKITNAARYVSQNPKVATRTSDGATLHKGIIDGIEMDVIKKGDVVISAYPTGGAGGINPSSF